MVWKEVDGWQGGVEVVRESADWLACYPCTGGMLQANGVAFHQCGMPASITLFMDTRTAIHRHSVDAYWDGWLHTNRGLILAQHYRYDS